VTSERQLISQIRALARASRNRAVVRGIGDDCAVLRLRPGAELLLTTDLSIEDVHFRRNWHPPRSVGHRCLARGLSDIAAMGGEPLACFLSLGLPPGLPQRWPGEFLDGLQALAKRYGLELAGGDLSTAHKITADIVVTGQVPAGKALLRSTAKPGDRIFVTGQLGRSAAILHRLYAGEHIRPARLDRHFFPEPRLATGRLLLRRGLATSMIDLSDGLSTDLAHICQESGVSARIVASQIPVAQGADLNLALHGGEDYELLFTTPARARPPRQLAGVELAEIGVIQKRDAGPDVLRKKTLRQKNYRPAIEILYENGRVKPLPPMGWQHFTK
jgi:thiamine-monophosphate kinase